MISGRVHVGEFTGAAVAGVAPAHGNRCQPLDALTLTRERIVKLAAAEGADKTTALKTVARRTDLNFWTLHNIQRGRAKTVDASIFERIRTAYLDWCERQIAALQHEITIAREATPDADFLDLDDEIARLRTRVADARSAVAGDRYRGLRGRHADRSDFVTGADRSTSSRANSSQRRR